MHIVNRIAKGAGLAALSACLVAGAARAQDEITVAYFLEWPTANQVAQLEKTYDKELGVKVNWRAFGNGNEMSAGNGIRQSADCLQPGPGSLCCGCLQRPRR